MNGLRLACAMMLVGLLAATGFSASGLAADSSTDADDVLIQPMIELPWSADLTALAHGSGQPVRLQVPLTDALPVNLILTEKDMFAPGQKKVVYIDEEENIVREEPLDVYSYHGYAEGFPNSRAALTFDSTGFLGVLQVGELHVDYHPQVESQVVSDPANVPMVASYDFDTEALAQAFVALYQSYDDGSAATQGEPAQAVPGTPGVMPSTNAPESASADDSDVPGEDGPPTSSPADCVLLLLVINEDDLTLLQAVCNLLVGGIILFSTLGPAETGRVRPYADLDFRTTHSNYATRITNAYNAEQNMWRNQVGIELSIYTLYASPNYSTSTTCNTHRAAFTAAHATLSGIDAYQLFTGINLSNCNGNAERPGTSGELAANPDSIVEAVDHSGSDSYNPGSSDHLGMVSGHEIAHNWGERDHPQNCRNFCTSFNIMASGKSYHVRDYWFTTQTQERIIQATYGRITDPIVEL